MDQARAGENEEVLPGVLATASVVESSRDIARGRALARSFLTEVQAVHGLPVSDRVMGMVQLVVSELVTNACKFAAGSCALTLGGSDGAVEVTVWDSAWELPVARTDDPGRVGQHGLEIAMAVCRSFEVHREPVGKRIKAAVVLADDPGGSVAGHQIG